MKPKKIKGKTLNPPVAVASDMSKAVIDMITEMNKDIKHTLRGVFSENVLNTAMDGNVTSQSRISLNALLEKWTSRFDELAKYQSALMVRRTKKQANISVKSSLREIAKHLTVDMTYTNAAMQDVIKASTLQAANLIKLIPSEYIGEVQGEVMRSITSGRGMSELVPYLAKKYDGSVKRARNTALDQTNKAFQAIARTQVEALGSETFTWIHTGGSKHPRKEHIAMSGKEFRYDDPPVIDVRTGEKGLPGTAVNCRCKMRPNFKLN
jgi:SPP1 gp7 family putative phage head morphogenesis protein